MKSTIKRKTVINLLDIVEYQRRKDITLLLPVSIFTFPWPWNWLHIGLPHFVQIELPSPGWRHIDFSTWR